MNDTALGLLRLAQLVVVLPLLALFGIVAACVLMVRAITDEDKRWWGLGGGEGWGAIVLAVMAKYLWGADGCLCLCAGTFSGGLR